ncbi:hypothetical protein ES703_88176 [subsurface metagenome]
MHFPSGTTKRIPQSQEGLQALACNEGLVGVGGTPRGNTEQAGQGLESLFFSGSRDLPGPGPGPGVDPREPGLISQEISRSGYGMDAPGGGATPSGVSLAPTLPGVSTTERGSAPLPELSSALSGTGCRESSSLLSKSSVLSCGDYTPESVVFALQNPPSLVGQGITRPKPRSFRTCQDSGWLKGVCRHGTTRWIRLRCKRRDCPFCGEVRRAMIAWRIARGIDELADKLGAAWFVGTFDWQISKVEAVKVQRQFIKWLRKVLGYQVQYAATWEVTRSGRLHLNLILAPWRYVPQTLLSAKWAGFGGGPVVWVQRVGGGIGVEAVKARERIGGYLGKWEQMVEVGRGVAYSKGWPKLPENPGVGRQGEISWRWVDSLDLESILFWYEEQMGYWREDFPGEYRFTFGEDCGCFERPPPLNSNLARWSGLWFIECSVGFCWSRLLPLLFTSATTAGQPVATFKVKSAEKSSCGRCLFRS